MPSPRALVDSTIAHHVNCQRRRGDRLHGDDRGDSREELIEQHRWLMKTSPQGVIDRDLVCDCGWAGPTSIRKSAAKVVDLFKRSLLVVRTQIDNGAGDHRANDSSTSCSFRATPIPICAARWGVVANALDMAAFRISRPWFYTFCKDVITEDGYFYHKYIPTVRRRHSCIRGCSKASGRCRFRRMKRRW